MRLTVEQSGSRPPPHSPRQPRSGAPALEQAGLQLLEQGVELLELALTQDALDLGIDPHHLGLDLFHQGLRGLGQAHPNTAAIGLVGIAAHQAPLFHAAQDAGHAGQKNPALFGQLGYLQPLVPIQRPQNTPLLLGEAMPAEDGAEPLHHRLAGAQQGHGQRVGKVAQ
ncbi:hypothetical protein A3962_03520 [Meiothermus taiwanensis]|nr:hypothetical protein A3962_03520 [Meiothermus taiwanensis]